MFKSQGPISRVVLSSVSFYLLLFLAKSSFIEYSDQPVYWAALASPVHRNEANTSIQSTLETRNPFSSPVNGSQSAEKAQASSSSERSLVASAITSTHGPVSATSVDSRGQSLLQHSEHSSKGTTDGSGKTKSGTNHLMPNNRNDPLKSKFKSRRSLQEFNPDCDQYLVSRKPAIYGLRSNDADISEEGIIEVKARHQTKVYLIGRNLYSNLSVALTEAVGSPQDDCTHSDRIKSLQLVSISLNVAEVVLDLPYTGSLKPLFFCLREHGDPTGWYHQGSADWLQILVKHDWPIYVKLIVVACLLGLSGLFSGLNLGLMALDKNELQVIMRCGNEDEKRYATIIEPVRRRGNYLLCSILFSNTLVNSTVSVLIDDMTHGVVAVMCSTILIVMFGEILPQAFCSRHGLAVGAKTVWITNFCMLVTFPLSYPVSYCLNWALGEEIGHAYDRDRLIEFIQLTREVNKLEVDEVNIISGALKIKSIKVKDVMTAIDDVYMLDEATILNFTTIQTIVELGYSRIPVHKSGDKKDVISVLHTKDLALVDPDDNTPLTTMISFYDHPIGLFEDEMTLDKALQWFKTGEAHIALVRRVVNEGDKDPYYESLGIVTLEDVIEEIIQMEINDETDTLTDNRRKRRRKDAQVRKDFSQFTKLGTGDSSVNVVSPQLCLAAYQYLSTQVKPFSPEFLSDSILKRLLSQRIFYKVKPDDDPSTKRLYTFGEPADYFIMLLEGKVYVEVGKEKILFDTGPFNCFGLPALNLDEPPETMRTSRLDNLSRRNSVSKPSLSRRESVSTDMLGNQTSSNRYLDLIPKQSEGDVEMNTLSTSNQIAKSSRRGLDFFESEYTVEIVSETSYLKVTRKDYITAVKATLVERSGPASSTDMGDE